MAGVNARLRDRNRYKKVYPFVRRRQVLSYLLEPSTVMTIETGELTLTNASSGTFTFTETFLSAPTVTAVAVDTTVGDSSNVNVYISSVSTTTVTFKTSATMTGKIHFHAIYIA